MKYFCNKNRQNTQKVKNNEPLYKSNIFRQRSFGFASASETYFGKS